MYGDIFKRGKSRWKLTEVFPEGKENGLFSYQFLSTLAYGLPLEEIRTLFTSRPLQEQVEHASVEARSSQAERAASCFCRKRKEYVEMVNAEGIGGMLTAFYRG